MRVVLLVLAFACLTAAQPIPQFNAYINETTISGLSSGGFMVVQLHVAFSKTIKGAAVFAGGPYDCAGGSEITAVTTCMSAEPSPPSVDTAILVTDLRASAGVIDPPSNLANSQVYMYSGTLDSTVNPKVMDVLYQYYSNYISTNQIDYVNNVTSAHTQPTDEAINTNPCWLSMSPYLSDCNYDGAGAALARLFSPMVLKPRNDGPSLGTVISFDQTPYVPGGSPALVSLADTGYAYVPTSCKNGAPCMIHIAFHGCAQNVGSVGKDYVERTGLNKWADTNSIVVLYPQTIDSSFIPSNPNGCWDWWGYAGSNYDVAQGPQMQFVMNLMKAATKPHSDTQ